MALHAGAKIGPYAVVERLGAGGMGEVYRARDTRLNRDVALKLLPESLTNDPDRVSRLRREAQVLASLNHTHIGAIYGLEDAGGAIALVLELVEGPTLEDRLSRGPMAADEALPVARQIADALEAAHSQGVVHRDLKPSNIKLRPDGTVKVLDFGLAKAMDSAASASDVSNSPTVVPLGMTRTGVVIGTAAYMSPEQARGQTVDRRTDVWAFGCVLYEMLTGAPAFAGDNVSDVIASVLRSDPDWTWLPADATPIVPVLHRCLEKDPARRLRDIGDVKLLLDDAVAGPPAAQPISLRSSGAWKVAASAAVALVIGAAGAALVDRSRTRTPAAPVRRFDLATTKDDPLTVDLYGTNVAISPDGSRIVYTSMHGTVPELVMRRLDEVDAKPLPGTDGGFDPFFSPDGQYVGYATFTELRRVPVGGGPSVTVCRVDAYFSGAAWAPDGTIVFTQGSLGLFRATLGASAPQKIAAPDASKQEAAFARPTVLPDGQTVLYTEVLSDGSTRIAARRLAGGEPMTIVQQGFGPLYLRPPGYLIYGEGERLMAVPFDAAAVKVTGVASAVQDRVFTKAADAISNVAAANDGTMVYLSGHNPGGLRRLMFTDRARTRVTPAIEQPVDYPRLLRLSPDGRRLAVTIGPPARGQIWIYDLAGGAPPLRLTFENHNLFATWSPDGRRIAFMSRSPSQSQILSLSADGSGSQPERLTTQDVEGALIGYTPDGSVLLFDNPKASRIWRLSVGDGSMSPWFPTPFTQTGGRLSPDGRFLAYASNQSGADEVWVRPYPGPGAPIRVSTGGGLKPLWAHDGSEIFYENGPKLMAARVIAREPDVRIEAPRLLFEGGFVRDGTDPHIRFMDVAPDGRILFVEAPDTTVTASIVVTQSWDEELRRLVR